MIKCRSLLEMTADDRVNVFVLDASGALHQQETGNSASNTTTTTNNDNNNNETFGIYGSDSRLRWQAVSLVAASLLLVFLGATMWYPAPGDLWPSRRPRYELKADPVQGVHVETVTGSCEHSGCTSVTCEGFTGLKELQDALLKLNHNFQCTTLSSLSITGSSIGPTLEKNWVPESVHVQDTLTLDNLDVADIASDAFRGAQLSNVTNLILSNLPNVTLLRRDIFRPLVNLGGVRLDNLHGLVKVEKGIVSDLPSPKFNDLQLTSDLTSVADLLPSFTGEGNTLPHLVKVIYAGNLGRLRYDQLAGLNLNSVAMVILQGAGITAVEEGALVREARGVQELVLTLNGLTTLAQNALDIARFPKNSIFLEKNPWDCTCPLAWLLNVTDHINDNPRCATPSQLLDREIKSLSYEELCDDVTETPSEPPATTAPPPPTTPGPCDSAEAEDPPGDFRGERILTETPQGTVVVKVPDAFRHQSMEWSGNDGHCYQVDVGARSLFQVSAGLKRGASYTFCFLEGPSVVIGRCYPITLLPPDDDRAWLTNGDKLVVIAGVVAAAVLALLIPGCLIVAALRRWPAILGKHIVVVKWRREDTVLAMPRDYEDDAHSAGSDAPTYITPERPTACQYASYYARRLGDVFRRSAGPRLPTNGASKRPSLSSTITSDEGDFGAGRHWSRAPEPTPAWVRRPDFRPWGVSGTALQVARSRGVSSTSAI